MKYIFSFLIIMLLSKNLLSQDKTFSISINDDNGKLKLNDQLIINSENKDDFFLVEILYQNVPRIAEIEWKFNEPYIIDLNKPIFKKGEQYTINFSIPDKPEFSGDSRFFEIKKGISFIGWVGIAGGTAGLIILIRSFLSSGKTNPPLPEPPIPGGG